MYIIVAGMGRVGRQIVETLIQEGHNLAAIESESQRLGGVENLDLLTVHGSAASISALLEAGINSADLFIAATGSDEVNIISCIIAKSKGCKTIARVNSQDYMPEGVTSGKLDLFGIDLAICPNRVTSNQMAEMLLLPSLVESEKISKSGSMIISFFLAGGSGARGKNPAAIGLPQGCVLASISRMGAVIDPDLAGELREGDKVFVVANSKDRIPDVEKAFGIEAGASKVVGAGLQTGIDKVMIVGANEMGIHLASILEKSRHVVLIDEDEKACEDAASALEKALVINASGIDDDALKDEGIEEVGAFVATTASNEFNMLSCLLARHLGVGKTMAVVHEPDLRPLFEQIGITVTICPRIITANTMLKYVPGSTATKMATAPTRNERVLEIKVTEDLWVIGKEFGRIKLPHNCFIGAVIRDKLAIVPTKFDLVRAGDRLILFVGAESLRRVEKLFMKSHKRR